MGTISSIFSKPKPPHNYEAILKYSDSALPPDATSSLDKLYPQLFDGVFLKDKKQVFNLFLLNFLLFFGWIGEITKRKTKINLLERG